MIQEDDALLEALLDALTMYWMRQPRFKSRRSFDPLLEAVTKQGQAEKVLSVRHNVGVG